MLFLVIVGCLYYFILLIKVNVNQAFILSNVDVGMARVLGFASGPIVSFLMVFHSLQRPPGIHYYFANAPLGWVYGAILRNGRDGRGSPVFLYCQVSGESRKAYSSKRLRLSMIF